MFQWTVLSLFLYFPEDKTEYIPAAISSFIFLIAAVLTMRFIMKKSRKDEEKFKEVEARIMNQGIHKEENR